MKSAMVMISAMFLAATSPAASRDAWLELNPPGTPSLPQVELDVSSIHEGLLGPEATIRVSLRNPQRRHDLKGVYRSWRMDVRFDCTSGRLEPLAMSFFSGLRGQGQELDTRMNLNTKGVPVDLLMVLPRSVLSSLLKAACRRESERHR